MPEIKKPKPLYPNTWVIKLPKFYTRRAQKREMQFVVREMLMSVFEEGSDEIHMYSKGELKRVIVPAK